MTKPKTYLADDLRFCLKCRSWQSQDGGIGAGTKYRCGTCNLGRLLAMRPVVLTEKAKRELAA